MSDLALRDCGRWLSGGTPDTGNPAYWGGDIPWITSSSLKGRYLDRSLRQLTEEGVVAGSRLVEPGTLVFVVRGMSLKNEFRVGISTTSLAFGQDCKALVPEEGIDPKYLLFALEAAEDRILRMVDEASHGTGRLQTSLLGSLRVRVPPLEEQRRIAEILDTIDETIQATDRVIAKLEIVRRGLIETLIPTAPMVALGALASVTVGFVGPTQMHYTSSDRGVAFLRTGNIGKGRIRAENLKYVTLAFHAANRKSALRVGDVVVSRVGYTGSAAVIDKRFADSNCANVIMIRPASGLASEFLSLLFESELIGRQVEALTAGSAQPVFNIKLVERLQLPNIGLAEQSAAVAVTDGVTERIGAETATFQKLEATRSGLASDLLSGRVRTMVA